MSRFFKVRTIATALLLALVTGGFARTASAQVWRDAATGQPVASGPITGTLERGFRPGDLAYTAVLPAAGDPNRAFDPVTGRNFVRDPVTCIWKDAATGQPVAHGPITGTLERGFRPGDLAYTAVLPAAGDPNRAFDPVTGRNFVRGPCRPTQTAAAPPPPTPQVGMVIEPKIGIGIGTSSSEPKYDSTGGQAPFNGDFSQGFSQLCGGATIWPGFVVGPARVGLDVNLCSGSNLFGNGDHTLFRIPRHGPGDVDLRASTNVIIDVLFKGEMPVGPTGSFFVSAGIGPTFRDLDLGLTSNQSFFGGDIASAGESMWQTGLAISAGLSTFACPNCIAGNPLKIGVEGRARFFPEQSISVRSPAFGFTETGSTGRWGDYSATINASVPIAWR